MHILYIGALPPHPGGSAIVAGQVLPRLMARGHRVSAISGTPRAPDHQESDDQGALGGIRTYRYPIESDVTDTVRIVLADLRRERPGFRAAYRRALADGRPDVVLAGPARFAMDAANVARALDVPFVQVEHSRRSGVMASSDPAYVAAATRAAKRAELRILVAENLRELHTGSHAVVAPNAVEVDRFRPRPRDPALAAGLGIDPGHVVILHASNLRPLKRAEDIVAAMPSVLGRVPAAHLVILGDGVERAPLRATVHALGLDRAVSFVDWQPRERMPEWYALADIVVMASTTEARSLTGLEAMASGRVLVATDIPAFRETVTDGIDGLLYPVGDVPALADRIATAATDADLRARIGAAARDRSLGWSMDRLVAGWEAALELAVRGTAGPPAPRTSAPARARRRERHAATALPGMVQR